MNINEKKLRVKTLKFFKAFYGSLVELKLNPINSRIGYLPKSLTELYEKNFWYCRHDDCKKFYFTEVEFDLHFFDEHYLEFKPQNSEEYRIILIRTKMISLVDELNDIQDDCKHRYWNHAVYTAHDMAMDNIPEYKTLFDYYELLSELITDQLREKFPKYFLK